MGPKDVFLEKITLNMGAGDNTQQLENSKKVLEKLSGKKVVLIKTKKRSTFGTPKNRGIGVKVTLRGREAADMLERLRKAIENKIKPTQFDSQGNFSFGVKEYIHIPGINYDPDIGILGLDVAVTLQRIGFRVSKRRIRPGRVGKNQLISKEESMEWAKKNGFLIVDKVEEPF